ncbi:MAG: hypothetical protein EBQ80_06105 [Proteobacteria bacterium]|nr:hypothetical protein [Pseudomonadota bacterium]
MQELSFSLTKQGMPVLLLGDQTISFSRNLQLNVQGWPSAITLTVETDTNRTMLVIRGCRRKENKTQLTHGNIVKVRLEDGICFVAPQAKAVGLPTHCYNSYLKLATIGETLPITMWGDTGEAYGEIRGTTGW